MITKITLLTLVITLITLLMTTTANFSKRWKILFGIIFSCITSFGIMQLLAFFGFGNKLYLWGFNEYFDENNWRIFRNEVLAEGFIYAGISALFFYIALPQITSKIFHKKLRKYFFSVFDKDEPFFKKVLNATNNAKEVRQKLLLINPNKLKTYDKSKKDEYEYDLQKDNVKMSLYIHAIISLFIFNPPYKWIFLLVVFTLLLGIIIAKPYLQALTDKLDTYQN